MGALPQQPSRSASELMLVANELRHNIIRSLEAAGSGHPGGALSAVEIVTALYFGGILRYDPANPKADGRDFFILSKGHAAPVLYAAFKQLGWIDDADLLSLRHLGSKLQGHPDRHMCPGIEVNTGSLGQGLSIGLGAALGFLADAARDGSDDPRRVYVLTGDGELQEGSNWEAIMLAAHRRVSNLTCIVDFNDLQIDGHVHEVCSLGDLSGKFAAFGWNVAECNGHDLLDVSAALLAAQAHTAGPTAVIAHTVKGKGVSFMEDQVGWHGVAPNHEQAAAALAELDSEREALRATEKEA